MEKQPICKQHLFASDFDQTLSFNDSGYVLSELLDIPTEEFERKAAGMAKLNLLVRDDTPATPTQISQAEGASA
jgi:hypothetical protein